MPTVPNAGNNYFVSQEIGQKVVVVHYTYTLEIEVVVRAVAGEKTWRQVFIVNIYE